MTDEYIRRTAITRLAVSETAHDRLEETLTQWRRGCQIAVDMAWDQYHTQRRIQSIAYDRIRDETDLVSQHAILATYQAAEAIGACKTREENGRTVSKPTFTAPTIRYDTNSMTLFDDETVSLATVGDRVRCDLVLPDSDDGYQYQYLSDEVWELTESTLTIRDGEWYLHLGFRKLRPSADGSTAENGTVLGVDLGIENLAVTSTGQFFSGRELQHRRDQYHEIRSRIQQVGSRSAYRTHRQMSVRFRRFADDYLHRVANGIVAEARQYNCRVVAFEDLTGILDRLPGGDVFHNWAFDRLQSYVEYKSAEYGIDVWTVDPRDTSTTCSRTDCGHVSSANRPERDRFACTACGYEVHADYNAAKNIGLRAVRCGPKSSHRTGVSQCALKSGTLSPTAGYRPLGKDTVHG